MSCRYKKHHVDHENEVGNKEDGDEVSRSGFHDSELPISFKNCDGVMIFIDSIDFKDKRSSSPLIIYFTRPVTAPFV